MSQNLLSVSLPNVLGSRFNKLKTLRPSTAVQGKVNDQDCRNGLNKGQTQAYFSGSRLSLRDLVQFWSTCTADLSHRSPICVTRAPAGSLDSKSVTMIVRKISEKGLQIGKLSRTEKLEKRGAFLEQLPEKF